MIKCKDMKIYLRTFSLLTLFLLFYNYVDFISLNVYMLNNFSSLKFSYFKNASHGNLHVSCLYNELLHQLNIMLILHIISNYFFNM